VSDREAIREALAETLSPAQAAHILGVTPQRVQALVDEGQLVGFRTPLGRLVERESVHALAARRAAAAATSQQA
jgi:hypothetical protein